MFDDIKVEEFERIAARTGAFQSVEIDLLHETLASWKTSPGNPYILLEVRDGKTLAAFAIISKTSGRESTYDIRYLVVNRDYQQSRGGSYLLSLIDEELLKRGSYAVIRIESAGNKLQALGAATLEDAGYKLIGHIPNFFGEGNDYYYYIRAIYRPQPTEVATGATTSATADTGSSAVSADTDAASTSEATNSGAAKEAKEPNPPE